MGIHCVIIFLLLGACSSLDSERECKLSCDNCRFKNMELTCKGILNENELKGVT